MKLIATIFAILVLAVPAGAQPMIPRVALAGPMVPGTTGSGGASCAASATYLAAQTGLDSTHVAAYDTAICALVNAGEFGTLLDALYFFDNSSAANARVNVVHPGTFDLVQHGTCTFTVDRGFAGDGSTCYLDSGFVPSTAAGNMTLNSGSVGVCVLNNRTTLPSTMVAGGASTGTQHVYIAPLVVSGQTQGSANNSSDATQSLVSTAQGASYVTTSPPPNQAIGQTEWVNGASQVNNRNNAALVGFSITVLALNVSGTPTDFSTDQEAYFFFGAGLSDAQVASIRSILSTMMFTLGAPNVC